MTFSDIYPENNLYGFSFNINKFLDIKNRSNSLNSYVEHGLFLSSYVSRLSYEYNVKNIITFSEFREKSLMNNVNIRNANINIVKIGPYISYCNSILNEVSKKEIKNKYGRILLVFPSHSIEKVTIKFDNKRFVDEILNVKSEVKADSVFVCLYWKDIEVKEISNLYERHGFRIVCAGHKNDKYFLNRLRSIIEVSDFTMSNEVGTHVGYCIYLKKPHYIFSQHIDYEEGLLNVIKAEKIDENVLKSQEYHKRIIEMMFSKVQEISKEQEDVTDYYWGLHSTRSKDELRQLLGIC
ncbi:MAG: hypothetical protein PHX08_06510 [Lachnospiraceae bacterium]|nr:hypothetical protein [Lachnospiraceae bacterium]